MEATTPDSSLVPATHVGGPRLFDADDRLLDPPDDMVASQMGRFMRIGGLAAQMTASYRFLNWLSPRLSPGRREMLYQQAHQRNADAFYQTSVDLKGAFLKIGQFLSMQQGLLPQQYLDALAPLHDRVPTVEYAVIKRVIEDELGDAPEHIFKKFEEKPLAAASLGQVHRAWLPSGEKVAVKVQFPYIEKLVKRDMVNLEILTRILGPMYPQFSMRTLNDELQRLIPRELNYLQEGKNAERFAKNFAHNDHIVVPGIHWDFTTQRVLTMDYIDGVKVEDIMQLTQKVDETTHTHAPTAMVEKFLELFVDAYAQQILMDGFFHADPHPGNFFIMPGPKIAFIDFGCMKEFTPEVKRDFGLIAKGVRDRDSELMAWAFHNLGFETKTGDIEPLVKFAEMFTGAIGDNDDSARADAIRDVRAALSENPVVTIPPDFFMLGKVFQYVGAGEAVVRAKHDEVAPDAYENATLVQDIIWKYLQVLAEDVEFVPPREEIERIHERKNTMGLAAMEDDPNREPDVGSDDEQEEYKDPRELMAEARKLAREIEKTARDQAREIERTAKETAKALRDEQRSRRHERRSRERARNRRRRHRKEKTLNLRIGEDMADRLKEEADERSMPVSELVRDILAETFEVVEEGLEEMGGIVGDVVNAVNETRKADLKAQIERVTSWQEVILNRSATCAYSGDTIPAGEKAYLGATEWPTRKVYVARGAMDAIREDARKRGDTASAAEQTKTAESPEDNADA